MRSVGAPQVAGGRIEARFAATCAVLTPLMKAMQFASEVNQIRVCTPAPIAELSALKMRIKAPVSARARRGEGRRESEESEGNK